MLSCILSVVLSVFLGNPVQCFYLQLLERIQLSLQPLFIRSATCSMHGPVAMGTITFHQPLKWGPVKISGYLRNLSPGQHAMHIHTKGDVGNDCLEAGPHYSNFPVTHGGTITRVRHLGDLANIHANQSGIASFSITGKLFLLPLVIGRALVVHSNPDDLGTGKDVFRTNSLLTGNSGIPVGCCLITPRR